MVYPGQVRRLLTVAISIVACDTTIPIGNLSGVSSESGGAGEDSGSALPELRQDAIALFDFRGSASAPYPDQRGSVTLAVPDTIDATLLEPASNGLRFAAGGMLASASGAEEITAACMASNELTVEVWATPIGPQELRSRLVTLSADATRRNFALGLGANDGQPGEGQCAEESRTAFGVGTGTAAYFFRRRLGSEACSTCEANGYPELWTQIVAEERVTHVVATHAADGADRIYVDAELQAGCSRSGSFAEWDPTYPLQIGDELLGGDRRFSGIVHLVAIYARALSPTEVRALFAASI